MKKKDKNLKWYLAGEFLGRSSVFLTECLIITSVLGMACEIIWDVKERKQYSARKKQFNNKVKV